MLIEADERGCTAEVLVIVAALSIQDVRERPTDQQAQADQAHARWKSAGAAQKSDFASLLVLWRYLKEQQKARSGSAFRRMCKAEFLHYLRVREWQDLHSQLERACKDVRIDPKRATAARDAEPDWQRIHQSLLAGLLSHIGLRDERTRDYQGARGARFSIQPGSALFRRQPDYVMSAELVETTRLWARTNAEIDPRWAEEIGAHLVKRTYAEPHWSSTEGAALARERVTLYGVPIVVDRRVHYGRINPEEARDLFIRHALVEGDWETRHRFVRDNERVRAEAEQLEERSRRRGIVVSTTTSMTSMTGIPPDVARPALRHVEEGIPRPAAARLEPRPADPGHAGDQRVRLPAAVEPGRDRPVRRIPVQPGAADDGVSVRAGEHPQPGHADDSLAGPGAELVAALIKTCRRTGATSCPPGPRRQGARSPAEGRGRLVGRSPGSCATRPVSR